MRGAAFSRIVDPDLRVSTSQSAALSFPTYSPPSPLQGAFCKIRGIQRL